MTKEKNIPITGSLFRRYVCQFAITKDLTALAFPSRLDPCIQAVILIITNLRMLDHRTYCSCAEPVVPPSKLPGNSYHR